MKNEEKKKKTFISKIDYTKVCVSRQSNIKKLPIAVSKLIKFL